MRQPQAPATQLAADLGNRASDRRCSNAMPSACAMRPLIRLAIPHRPPMPPLGCSYRLIPQTKARGWPTARIPPSGAPRARFLRYLSLENRARGPVGAMASPMGPLSLDKPIRAILGGHWGPTRDVGWHKG